MISTYLIKSQCNKSFYVGISKDPVKRLSVHNRGGLKTTSSGRPWQLIYQKEHNSYELARKHERWLKKKSRDYKNKIGGVK